MQQTAETYLGDNCDKYRLTEATTSAGIVREGVDDMSMLAAFDETDGAAAGTDGVTTGSLQAAAAGNAASTRAPDGRADTMDHSVCSEG